MASLAVLPSAAAAPDTPATKNDKPGYWDSLPAVAVWSLDRRLLRFALWEDGRIAFSEDPGKWSGALREGRLDARTTRQVLKEVAATGIFELPGHCYLVPDAPVLGTLARFGGRQQLLYWDEVEAPSYGINIAPQPHHLAFKRAWHAVTRAVAKRLPRKSRALAHAFSPPPSWLVKERVQSK